MYSHHVLSNSLHNQSTILRRKIFRQNNIDNLYRVSLSSLTFKLHLVISSVLTYKVSNYGYAADTIYLSWALVSTRCYISVNAVQNGNAFGLSIFCAELIAIANLVQACMCDNQCFFKV